MLEINKYIGSKIRELREAKNITQKELGDFLSYSPMAISHFENGIRDIKPSDLQKIADYFKAELSSLFPPKADTTFFRSEPGADETTHKSLQEFENFINTRNE